jgi:ribosomal-protein-serine acetyltransferase
LARMPDELTAEMLTLRRWREHHLDELMQAIRVSHRELQLWMPWALEMPSEDAERDFLLRANKSFEAGSEFVFGIFEHDGDTLVGSCGLSLVELGVSEIGYWIRSDRTGRGYATAAAKALTRAAFSYFPEVERVEIHCDVAILASAAVPAKLGYRFDREIDRDVLTPGQTGRSRVWAITGEEFTSVPAG